MARKWRVEVEKLASSDDVDGHTLAITGLKKAQVEFIRCMLQADYEVDPVQDWGFKKKDGDLQTFRITVASEIEKAGF